jgi:hypothetical protein
MLSARPGPPMLWPAPSWPRGMLSRRLVSPSAREAYAKARATPTDAG